MRIFVGWRESVVIRRHTVWGASLDISSHGKEFGHKAGTVQPLAANRAATLCFCGMRQSARNFRGKFAARVSLEANSTVPG